MSKLVAALLLVTLSTQALAECQPVGVSTDGQPVYQCTYNTTNMAPINQQIYTPPPVVVQQQNCSPWTEIRNPDGSTTVTRTCN